MLLYKMAFLSNLWTPKVLTRVTRDILNVQRLTKANRILLCVASNRDLTAVLAGVQNIQTTTDLSDCQVYRVYVDRSMGEFPAGTPEPEDVLPQDIIEFDFIDVGNPPVNRTLKVDKDPYAGIHLPDRFTYIKPTMDQMRDAPKPVPYDEPPYNPFR